MSRTSTERWRVERYVLQNVPYRVEVPEGLLRVLEVRYLEFVRQPKGRGEIEAMLAGACDCPAALIPALQMTLYSGLVHGHRNGRSGRLVDITLNPRMEYATGLGMGWLLAQQEKDENEVMVHEG
jgi:hypothetical protein